MQEKLEKDSYCNNFTQFSYFCRCIWCCLFVRSSLLEPVPLIQMLQPQLQVLPPFFCFSFGRHHWLSQNMEVMRTKDTWRCKQEHHYFSPHHLYQRHRLQKAVQVTHFLELWVESRYCSCFFSLSFILCSFRTYQALF